MIRHIALAALCSFFTTALVPAQDPVKPGEKPPAKEPQKPASVFVVALVDGKHEVMNKEAVEAKNKAAEADHKKAMDAFEKEKKAAEAAHKKFEGKEPKKQVITIVGAEHQTKEAAEAALKKLLEEEAKKKEKPAEKPAEKPPEPPKK